MNRKDHEFLMRKPRLAKQILRGALAQIHKSNSMLKKYGITIYPSIEVDNDD